VHNLTLVTRNTRDFEQCMISLLNPFAGLTPDSADWPAENIHVELDKYPILIVPRP